MTSSAASLLLRLGIGATFIVAGLEKVVRGAQATAAYFASLGMPLPEVSAPLVSWFELIGGVLLVLGGATVVVSMLFALEMLFVIVFVRIADAAQAFSLVDAFVAVRLEVLLALGATAIAVLGSGAWSIDEWLPRRFRRE